MTSNTKLDLAFPAVDPCVKPLGSRLLVQIRNPKERTESGIILDVNTKETERWNTTVAKVIAVGPLAFKNRDTQATWPEGEWCKVGDFVRVPKYGGDRFSMECDVGEALFVIVNDLEVIGLITGDPLAVKAFI